MSNVSKLQVQPGDLKIHVENKHEGVRYPCSKCEYAATTTHSLKRHVKIKHKC